MSAWVLRRSLLKPPGRDLLQVMYGILATGVGMVTNMSGYRVIIGDHRAAGADGSKGIGCRVLEAGTGSKATGLNWLQVAGGELPAGVLALPGSYEWWREADRRSVSDRRSLRRPTRSEAVSFLRVFLRVLWQRHLFADCLKKFIHALPIRQVYRECG
jgi:hypothetical protein